MNEPVKMPSTEVILGNHPVFVGNKVFMDINHCLKTNYNNSKLFILVDENSLHHCFPQIVATVEQLKDAEIIEIESGEKSKNIEVCTQIWQALSDMGADRKSLLINIGGGVVSDIGGFIASAFKRGIDFINIPTTLLAQVDASVGGKTGINLDHLKNEIGFFNNPHAVFVYPPFLKTLDKRQLLSGYAEIIKHALIADKNYWTSIQSVDGTDVEKLTELIFHSIAIKNKIVLEDPKEKGIRKVLNFGHTIGHAIESYTQDESEATLLHGEAIAIGMICEAFLSYKKKLLSHEELDEITSFIHSVFGIVNLEQFDEHKLIELMRHDKKNENDTLAFTLLNGIGKAEINKVCSIELVKEALFFYREQAV